MMYRVVSGNLGVARVLPAFANGEVLPGMAESRFRDGLAASLAGILTVPVAGRPNRPAEDIQQEPDNSGALDRPGGGLLEGPRYPRRRPDGGWAPALLKPSSGRISQKALCFSQNVGELSRALAP